MATVPQCQGNLSVQCAVTWPVQAEQGMSE